MRKVFHFLIILGLTSAGLLCADILKQPPMTGQMERGTVVTKTKDGGPRWKADWTMERTQSEGQDVIRMTETGQGVYSGFNGNVRWTIDAWWTGGDSFRPLRFDKTVKDSSGRIVLEEHKQFNWKTNQVRFERRDPTGGKSITKTIAVPADTLTGEGIAGALRALPFSASLRFPTHFLTNEPKLYAMTLEVRGRESIRVGSKTYDCYKVELVPKAGALIRFLFPKVYFWFSVDPQHTWVRYAGPENGPGTPNVIMERGE
jgi:Protein of unknown function (DUF3108)